MMRVTLSVLSLLAVAACAPEVPDSAAGVGFGDYDSYQQQREAALSGITSVPLPQQGVDGIAAPAPVAVDTNNPGISDEQNFQAVAARETIESDAQRLEAQREQYEVIAPTAVPARTGTGPNIVEYALSTTNRVGEPLYRRTNPLRHSAAERNCAKYTSGDLAQEAFLKAGGPHRDKLSLDPDGDGFACYWDPSPFRLVVNH
ncbi:hypothetical protein [Actibacterium sp. D379-3]